MTTTEQEPTTTTDETGKPTLDDVAESMNGFDELSITKHFGTPAAELMQNDGLRATRAMAFVLHRRNGLTDKDAYLAVMQATTKAVQEMFALVDSGEEDEGNG